MPGRVVTGANRGLRWVGRMTSILRWRWVRRVDGATASAVAQSGGIAREPARCHPRVAVAKQARAYPQWSLEGGFAGLDDANAVQHCLSKALIAPFEHFR